MAKSHKALEYDGKLIQPQQRCAITYNKEHGWLHARISCVQKKYRWVIYEGEQQESPAAPERARMPPRGSEPSLGALTFFSPSELLGALMAKAGGGIRRGGCSGSLQAQLSNGRGSLMRVFVVNLRRGRRYARRYPLRGWLSGGLRGSPGSGIL